MPGGGKKAVFPPLNLHDHDPRIGSSEHQERQKKLLQARGKSMDQKDSPEKDKTEKNRNQASGSKPDQLKTPTKEQKDLLKQEHLRLKNEQKAQQKLEKEHAKHEKELQKEQQKLEKEQLKLEKEQLKIEKEQSKTEREQKSPSKNCFKSGLVPEKGSPVLKPQRSLDVSSIKQQKSSESPKPSPRKSVDLQYTRELFEAAEITEPSTSASSVSLAKSKIQK